MPYKVLARFYGEWWMADRTFTVEQDAKDFERKYIDLGFQTEVVIRP